MAADCFDPACRPAEPTLKNEKPWTAGWFPVLHPSRSHERLDLTPSPCVFDLAPFAWPDITLCEVRNTAGPSHHDLVNGSFLEIDQIRRSELRLSLPFGLVRQPLARRRGIFVVGDTPTSPGKDFDHCNPFLAFADQTSSPVEDSHWCDITLLRSRYP